VISKKVREMFASLMEATCNESAVQYDNETEHYTGYFNPAVVDKYIEFGAIELVEEGGGPIIILLNNREDFLSGFASGVNEARLGNDQYYADFNSNPFAFSVGFEHFLHINKKPRNLVGYLCHGFINDETGEVHVQS
jgi:hypothetical protein